MKFYIKSNFIKIKNTSYLVVHSLAGLLFPTLLSLYWIQRGHINENTVLFSYFQIVGALLPFASSIVSVQLKNLEEESGKFKYLLGYSQSNYKPFFVELVFLWLCYSIVLLLSFSLFALFMITNGIRVILSSALLALLFYIILALIIYILNHMISYLYSTGVALGISMIGVIIAAFCETSLGDKVWFLIPWSWLLRISNILFNQQKIGISQLFIIIIISCILLFLHKYIFQNWNQERLSDG